MKKNIITCVIVCGTIISLLVIYALIRYCNNAAWGKLCDRSKKIQLGMTKEEVIAIMGKPHEQALPHRFDKEQWDAFWYIDKGYNYPTWKSKIYIEFDPHRVKLVEQQPNFQIKFNSDDWKRSSPIRRGCMIDDFLKTHNLNEMTKEDIVNLLGDPKPTNYFTDWDLVYCLGPEKSPFGIDSDWLVIKFNNLGRVTKFRIMPD